MAADKTFVSPCWWLLSHLCGSFWLLAFLPQSCGWWGPMNGLCHSMNAWWVVGTVRGGWDIQILPKHIPWITAFNLILGQSFILYNTMYAIQRHSYHRKVFSILVVINMLHANSSLWNKYWFRENSLSGNMVFVIC